MLRLLVVVVFFVVVCLYFVAFSFGFAGLFGVDSFLLFACLFDLNHCLVFVMVLDGFCCCCACCCACVCLCG